MAAPTPGTRTTPTGAKIDNGHKALISFALDPDLSIWETEVGMPGMDVGEPINTTTQHNNAYMTFAPRDLITLMPFDVKFQLAEGSYTQLTALLGKRTTVTENIPGGATLAYYAFLQRATFDPYVIGNPATGTATVVPTNWDPANNVEAGPVLTLPPPPPPP